MKNVVFERFEKNFVFGLSNNLDRGAKTSQHLLSINLIILLGITNNRFVFD